MTLLQSLRTLKKFRDREGHATKDENVEAFRIFWRSAPTIEQFSQTMAFCTIFSEFIYIMNTDTVAHKKFNTVKEISETIKEKKIYEKVYMDLKYENYYQKEKMK